ncbi:MAG: hypothetical protein H0U62_01440 [Actinobacteria bacterium]|nr:hypothetical protein [Actinomycetota bacterium]
MKSVYRVLAYLIAAGVVLQMADIAYAWFGVLNEVDSGAVLDENFEGNAGHALHGILGMTLIPLLGLVLLIVSFFAKVPGGVKWAAVVFGVIVLQVLLAFVSFGVPVIGLLHGVNALVLLGVAAMAAQKANGAGLPMHGGARSTGTRVS